MRWTREAVVEAVARLGGPVRASELRRLNAALYHAAYRHFGSWREALQAAGIQTPSWIRHPDWTGERVIDTLRQRHARGEPLGYGAANRGAGGLHAAARRLFGTWAAALQAAGVPSPSARTYRRWTREKILETIRERNARGQPIGYARVRIEAGGLFEAARRIFGSWRAAVEAVGLSYAQVRPRRWTPEAILAAIRERRDSGLPVRAAETSRGRSGMLEAVRREFGSWRKALDAAGIPRPASPAPRRKVRWTPQAILAAIRERHAAVLSIRSARVKREAGGLSGAALREFGSWRAAVEAAGLSCPEPRPRILWTRERVIDSVRERHQAGRPIAGRGVCREAWGLVNAGRKFFGGWRAAVEAAGIAYPGRLPSKRWTREEMVEALRKMEGEQGFAGAWRLDRIRREGYENLRLAIRREFGSLRRAKESAGVRTWPLWTRERVREAILLRRERGESLAHGAAQKENPRLVAGAFRAHGSWAAALTACGIDSPSRGELPWPRDKILNALKKERGPEGLVRWADLRLRYPRLRRAALVRFGSWSAALAAAGVREPPRERTGRWTREKILEALKHDQREGADLSRESVRARRGGGLVQAGVRHFGNWDDVLRAAGLAIPEHAPAGARWTSENILTTIRESWRKKRDARAESVTRGRAGLLAAAYRCFGGWRAAVRAAGVQPARRLLPPEWTRGGVLRALKREARRGGDLSSSALRARGDGLPAAIRLHFGKLTRALRAAGLGQEGSPGPSEGQTLHIPCRRCGAAPGIPYVVASGTQELRCTKCEGTTRVEARLVEGCGWRIRTA